MKKINNYKEKVENLENTYVLSNNENADIEVSDSEVLTIIEVIDSDIKIIRNLIVGENATLNYIKIGNSTKASNIKYINTIGDNAILNMFLFDFDSSNNTIDTKLESDNSTLNIKGLIDLKNSSHLEYIITTNHKIKSLSDIAFKNLLDGKSHAKLDMFSIVENSAAFSKAFQNSKTILLSDDSSIQVTPHLEISIDELEASHGATCGDLDKDGLYYLESRGIKEHDAKILLLNAIRNEVYSNLKDEKLIEYIRGL
jgi:Fe-S cluster assembly protein SufD